MRVGRNQPVSQDVADFCIEHLGHNVMLGDEETPYEYNHQGEADPTGRFIRDDYADFWSHQERDRRKKCERQ
jgi:hypothetical protein